MHREIIGLVNKNLAKYFNSSLETAKEDEVYRSLVMSVRDKLLEMRDSFHRRTIAQGGKRVYYLCMEFLLGPSLKTSLFNLGISDDVRAELNKYGFDINALYEYEPDPGLGNGGLGRLAACFMDSLATLSYPAMGHCIMYEYGLFRQKLLDGWQTELPDEWLPRGDVWLVPRTNKSVIVRFDGEVRQNFSDDCMNVEYVGATEVEAIPYDMVISGHGTNSVSVLRLWQARSARRFNIGLFSQGQYMAAMSAENEAEQLSKLLYPSDDHSEGKSLRLRQQYFLVSAAIQNIIRDHISRRGGLRTLPDYAAIHINDTHPAMCVPELMRILMDEHGFSWDDAWDIVCRTVAYTNHTVMAEALEVWQENLIQRRLPRIYQIIAEIDRRHRARVIENYPFDWNRVERLAIIANGQIRMANLSVVASHKVNGVSALHSGIIKNGIFREFAELETAKPHKFTNVTNGIAHRRWLCQSNPELTELLTECIGNGFFRDAGELKKFAAFDKDTAVLERLEKIKHANKERFAEWLERNHSISLDPDMRFDVQAKRLHEYKRQLMNALKIISIYNELLHNPEADIQPQVFIFGAKAASGYYFAKRIIKLIALLAVEIDKNPKISSKLRVVFLENYSVSAAEVLMPAAEVSQQISLAGKEASGTGNMKFMINGALTIGTLDGANVEMAESCGRENMFIFGMTDNQVAELWSTGYNSSYYYNNDGRIKEIIEMLRRGFCGESFADVANYLLTGPQVSDPYMCLGDFAAYMDAHARLERDYTDVIKWNKMSLHNIASAGVFAADRSVDEYAKNIWGLRKIR